MRPPIITLPQDTDLSPRREVLPGDAAITAVSARSRDTYEAGSTGQDFVAFCYDATRIAFALCDGVSQSFYGDLAARLLGTRLVDWLWTQDNAEADPFLHALDTVLRELSTEGTRLVQAKPIRADLPEMQKVALDRKRINGSEAMFVAGLIDRQADRISLCWMGDSRLHLWDVDHQELEIPGASWVTRERWSTRIGPKNGTPHGCILPIGAIARITAHSDGVGSYADQFAFLAQDQLISMVEALRGAPASDDVSVLDVDLQVAPEYGGWLTLATPTINAHADQTIGWKPVPFAESYRVAIDDGSQSFTVDWSAPIQSAEVSYPVQNLLGWTHDGPFQVSCRVQAFNEYTLSSAWSVPIEMTLPAIPILHSASAAATSTTTTLTTPESIPDKPLEPSLTALIAPVPSPTKTANQPKAQTASGIVIAVIVAVLLCLLAIGALLGGSAVWDWFSALQAAIRAS